MKTWKTSAHRAAGEALALEKESADVSRPKSEAVQQRGLLNFKALGSIVATLLRGADAGLWAFVGAVVGNWLAEVTR